MEVDTADNPEIEIPTHFLCPISLQLMRDPVTLSTGITYDRLGIEKWLSSSKTPTCPVTKQLLLDHDDHDQTLIITPNHTLRRLIQSWCTLNASYGIDRIPTPKQPPTVDRASIAKLLSDAKRSPQLRYASLQRIRSLLTASSNNLRMKKLLDSSGAFRYAASILTNEENILEASVRREKEEALDILTRLEGIEGKQIVKAMLNKHDDVLIDSLVEFLGSGSAQTREQAIGLLRFVHKVADPAQLANAKPELFTEIVNVIKDEVSMNAIKSGLKLLAELNPWSRNRIKAVESGAVWALVDRLADGSSRRVSEIAMVVLDQLCGCAEGRAEMLAHAGGLAVVSKKILRVSHVASERAVRILSAISRYSATEKVLQEMAEVGVVGKLCLVVQMDCGSKTKERAKDVLRLHSRVWRMSPCVPPHLMTSLASF